ncbi:zinc-dependent metalloprotease [Bogoriella caseilytica]|uniref:Putative hydrolase/coenzyme F420 biosynthesis associated uncharacterized protein n=1 Tax=Bogoriella caseilytica TaxID=56055 RepID=A0A3N2BB34_9MICO|nr:zinc-dependent metalloprotease [Bogoriella caseilytica]ROR72467.1 putative hydrolase/coenzyme F420 biosynthesis associated uncharacterized protein [Bogoriella caseilytica]
MTELNVGAAAGESTPVDWDAAVRRAAMLAPPGPSGTPADLRALVEVLRRSAAEAPAHIAEITGLHEAAAQAEEVPVFVVDRPRWSEANATMFASLIGDLMPVPSMPAGARLAGEEMGVILAILSTKVLGQYDPFAQRLLLVAPNVRKVERELELDVMDFRLWVCLHEQTHAVQFAAAPWLADHLRERMRSLISTMAQAGSSTLEQAFRSAVDQVTSLVRSAEATDDADNPVRGAGGGPLIESFLTEDQRDDLAGIVAVMSLLEGHADVVMDAVDPARLPSVRHIRKAFDRRRDTPTGLDHILRRVLGMDAKLAQYRDGAAFVRAVVDQVGHDGLAAVWSGPEQLPTAGEIADPASWVQRVHG